jgi:hypothetical protein
MDRFLQIVSQRMVSNEGFRKMFSFYPLCETFRRKSPSRVEKKNGCERVIFDFQAFHYFVSTRRTFSNVLSQA